MRTPKSRSTSNTIRAIRSAQWETIIGLTCVGLAIAVNLYRPQPTTLFLGGLLFWQSSLYLSALYYSLFSMREPEPRPAVEVRGKSVNEGWIARLALAAGAAVLIGVGGLLLLPAPTTRPQYAELQPKDIQVQQLVGLPAGPTETPTLSSPTIQPTVPTAIVPTAILPPTIGVTITATPLPTFPLLPTAVPTGAVPVTPNPQPTVPVVATSTLTPPTIAATPLPAVATTALAVPPVVATALPPGG
jgi:hypothetical protein